MSKVTLRPPKNRIELRAAWLWFAVGLLAGLLLLAVSVSAYVIFVNHRWWLMFVVVVIVFISAINTIVEPYLRYRIHRWEVTDKAVYSLTGWITREWRVAPISRIQTVDAIRGPLEQIFGLSTLRVTTASSKGAVEIKGLDKDIAARIAEELTVITEETPGDAT